MTQVETGRIPGKMNEPCDYCETRPGEISRGYGRNQVCICRICAAYEDAKAQAELDAQSAAEADGDAFYSQYD